MKLLFYIDGIGGGGAERVIANLANGFAQRGEKVVLVTSFPRKNEYEISGRVVRYNLEQEQPKARKFLRKNVRQVWRLRQICKKEKFDIAVSFMEGPNFRLIAATFFLKVKTIISLRSDPSHEYIQMFHKIIANTIYSLADACVFQTEDARKFFSTTIKKKSTIILNPIADPFFNEMQPTKEKKIVSVGRLDIVKNYKLLINAFSEIEKEYPDYKLVIYGDGEEKENLLSLISELHLEDKVSLPGRVCDVVQKLATASLFILSSEFEGLPNSLMEAMAMGLPVIATDCPCGGPRLLLQGGKCGILVPVDDRKSMIGAIKFYLDNKNEMEKYAMLARKRAEDFREENIYNTWDGLFRDLLERDSNEKCTSKKSRYFHTN